jgi:hypothetical protein
MFPDTAKTNQGLSAPLAHLALLRREGKVMI